MSTPSLKTVFVNGCFDPLTPGHVSFLQAARELGDRLVVAVNDDQCVRELKGEGRPIVPVQQRMVMLRALRFVDLAVPFHDENDLRDWIQGLRPDVLVKGDDYVDQPITGRSAVESWHGKLVFVPRGSQMSASELIERCRDVAGEKPEVDLSSRW